MSNDQPPQPADIRFAESGEIELFDGQNWDPVRKLPEEGPIVFRGNDENHQTLPET